MRLNMLESSLKKKRGISFFADNSRKDFDLLNIESQDEYICVEDVDDFGKAGKSYNLYESNE